MGLNTDDIDRLDVGIIYDMIVEHGNDDYDWPVLATQEDFDRF